MMRFFFSFLALAALAAHGEVLFEDDFDSYPDGYDLDDAPAWEYVDGDGIAVYSGSATTDAGNEVFIAAVGAVQGEDYTVGCEFTGVTEADGGKVLLCLRASVHYRVLELYYVDVHPSTGGYCLDLVYELDGNPEVLSGTCISADEDDWHHVAFSAVGSGPVEFEVYFDGDLVILHTETAHVAPAGFPGFGLVGGDAEPRVDGFVQTDGGATVVEASFGRIKALF
ncbi:MAG: hypothetical protein A2Y64_00235 [Candidatus Coatesbacteria bacterium RBG_13_66_14]|uniref:3-keto-disaccharide hydrolase domain-containing protein n=1 Tax=Candidatus Coatesbacteria bacterium RBG_13_66_14 TaxID=1817816 RepID=A0A1F5FJF0_9BACT|nr:MAG: hypothetical protein A2Y64_00235 [Candidatus Coatesbacteria bacterium RBG_13_66_14]